MNHAPMSDAAGDASPTRARPHRLRRELVVVLTCKLAALVLLYVLFFSPSHRPAVDVVVHVTGGTLLP